MFTLLKKNNELYWYIMHNVFTYKESSFVITYLKEKLKIKKLEIPKFEH